MRTAIRKTYENIALLLLANGLVKPLWLLAEQGVQNQVGHAAFGQYSSLYQLAYVLSWLIECGTNILVVQAIARQPADLLYVGRMATLRLLLGIVFLPLFLGIVLLWADDHAAWWGLAPGIGLTLLLNQYGSTVRSSLQGAQRFRADSWLTMADRGTLLLLLIPFFLFHWDVISYTWLALLSAVFCFVLQMRALRQLGVPLWAWPSRSFVWQAVRAGLPYLVFALCTSAHDRVAQVLLGQQQGNEAAGVYAAAFRWYLAAQMYVWVVIPVFTAAFAQPASADKPYQMQFEQGLGIVLTPISCAVLAFMAYPDYASYFIPISNATQTQQIATHLQGMAWPLFLLSIGAVLGAWLAARNQWQWLLLAGLAALCTNLACWVLWPYKQPAPLGLTVGYVALILIYAVGVHRTSALRLLRWPILAYCLLGPLAWLLGQALQQAGLALAWGLPLGCVALLALGGLVLVIQYKPNWLRR